MKTILFKITLGFSLLSIFSCAGHKEFKENQKRIDQYITYTQLDDDEDGVYDLIDNEFSTIPVEKLEGLPSFEFPPPPFSKIKNDELKAIFPDAKNFGDVENELSKLLKQAGYEDHFTFFKVNKEGEKNIRGWAIVTDFERIDEQGNILDDRWSDKVTEGATRFFLFKTLGKGYFRLFAFIITNSDFSTNKAFERSKNEIAEQVNSQKSSSQGLPKILKEFEFGDSYKLHVLTYEFFQFENDEDGYYIEMDDLPISKQLDKAGIKIFK